MPPYGVAIRSFLKMLKNGTFRMRIPTPLFAFGKNADVGHSLQVLGDEGALELVRAFGRFGMTENQLCLHIEGASFDAPSMLKTQISKLAQPLASAGITISGTLLNWDRLAVAMQLPILISILTPLMPWDSSIMSKRFFIRFSITTAMSMV